jgi:transposase-like protein
MSAPAGGETPGDAHRRLELLRWAASANAWIIEDDHALKRVIAPTRGFQTMKTAAAAIKGFEVMRMIRRGHCLTCKPHVKDEVRLFHS